MHKTTRAICLVVIGAGTAWSCGPTTKTAETASTQKALALHGQAELEFEPHYLHRANGRLETSKPMRHPWPYEPLSMGHTISSYQNYGGSPYFHHGLDIRGDAGTDVLAAAGGEVVNIENYVLGNPAYWEVAILDEQGFLWQYHHVDRQSIPESIERAHETGEPIEAGTKIGEIYYWPVETFGERFHHIHLNVLDAEGRYLNGLRFLEPLADEQSPQIEEAGLLKNGRRHAGREVSGRYSLYAKVHDLIQHDRFVLPPYRLAYRIDGGQTHTVWQFDDLPGGRNKERFVEDVFVPSLTCGNYRCRELTIDLGFKRDGAAEFPQSAGAHEVTIIAEDFAGNRTTRTFDWSVQ